MSNLRQLPSLPAPSLSPGVQFALALASQQLATMPKRQLNLVLGLGCIVLGCVLLADT